MDKVYLVLYFKGNEQATMKTTIQFKVFATKRHALDFYLKTLHEGYLADWSECKLVDVPPTNSNVNSEWQELEEE